MYGAVAVTRQGRRQRQDGVERLEEPAVKSVFAEDVPTELACSSKGCVICAYHRKKQLKGAAGARNMVVHQKPSRSWKVQRPIGMPL